MKRYLRAAIAVLATPMTLGEYNAYRGWKIPEDENPSDKGYLVEYLDNPEKVHPAHENYITWNPKKGFDRVFKEDVIETPFDRLQLEYAQLTGRIEPLQALLSKDKPNFISQEQWDLMNIQLPTMLALKGILGKRIESFQYPSMNIPENVDMPSLKPGAMNYVSGVAGDEYKEREGKKCGCGEGESCSDCSNKK